MSKDYRHDRDRWYDRDEHEEILAREERKNHLKQKRFQRALRVKDIDALLSDDE